MSLSLNSKSCFCVFCYKFSESVVEITESSKLIQNFVNIVNRHVKNPKPNALIVPDALVNKLTGKSTFLNCCNGCQDKLENFNKKYEQLKVLEMELDWKLDELVEKIRYANQVPARWLNVGKTLEKVFKKDLGKKSDSENSIRKFRQCVVNAAYQRSQQSEPRVLLTRNETLDENVILKKTAENKKLNDKITEEVVIRKAEEAKRKELALARKKFRQLHKDKICPKCGKKLVSFRGLQLHLENHKDESEWKFECDQCGRRFSARNELQVHLRIHNGDTPYKCPFCKRKFRIRKSYTGHLKTAHGDEEGLEEELKKRLFGKMGYKKMDHDRNSDAVDEELSTNKDVDGTNIGTVHTTATFKDPLIQIKYEHLSIPDNNGDNLHSMETMSSETSTGAAEYQMENESIKFQCPKCKKCCKSFFSYNTHLEMHKSPDEWKWRCAECNQKFATRGILRTHMEIHLNEKPLECQYCYKKFGIRKSLTQHLRKMHKNADSRDKKKNLEMYLKSTPFKCHYCEKRYGLKRNLIKHFRERHVNERGEEIIKKYELGLARNKIRNKSSIVLKCEICARKFISLTGKKRHFRQCHDMKKGIADRNLFKCKQNGCSAYFLEAHQLKFHRKLEHGEMKKGKNQNGKKRLEPPTCQTCGKKCLSNYKLRIHMAVHTKDKKHTCKFCGKEFGYRSSLQSHLREKHGNEQEVWDNIESEELVRKEAQKAVVIKEECTNDVVENEKVNDDNYDTNLVTCVKKVNVLECEICTRKFSSLLKKDCHFRKCHDMKGNTEESFKCKEIGCKAYFLKLFQLSLHRRLEHGDESEMEKIQKKNDSNSFECTICKKVYSIKNSFDLHMLSHKNKSEWKFECEKCGKKWLTKFKLKLHMRVHTKEKGYECRFCGRTFGYVSSLGNHLREKHGNEEEVKADVEMKKIEKKGIQTSVVIKEECYADVGDSEAISGNEIEEDYNMSNVVNEIVDDNNETLGNLNDTNVSRDDNTFGRTIESFGDARFVQLEELD